MYIYVSKLRLTVNCYFRQEGRQVPPVQLIFHFIEVCLQGEHKECIRKAAIHILRSSEVLNPREERNWQENIKYRQFLHLKNK